MNKNFKLPQLCSLIKKIYHFATIWNDYNEEHKMLVDLCFVCMPNEQGDVEVKDGTYSIFQGIGYRTKAVECLIN